MTLLSIILVNYNNSSDTIDCLKQLINQTFKDFEVIVVDNDSNENDHKSLNSFINKFQKLKQYNLKVFYQGINNGYSGGINYGVKRSSGKIILILNSDIIIHKFFLMKSIHFLNSNLNYKIMGPKIYYHPNKEKIYFTGGYFKFYHFSGANRIGRGLLDPGNKKINKIMEVDFISGCCMFVWRDVFRKVKLFDKNYFMYNEDIDFSYRVKQLGIKLVYFPKIVLYHKTDENKEKLSKFVKYNYFKNKFLFIFKHLHLILILYHLLISIFIIPTSFFKNRISYEKNLRGFFKIIKGIVEGISLGIKIRIT